MYRRRMDTRAHPPSAPRADVRSPARTALARRLAAPFVASLAACATSVPSAPPIGTLGDLDAKGAERIEGPALKALVLDSRLVTYDPSGRDRAWNNVEDGTFIATVRRTGLGSTGGEGRWYLGPDDTYCVSIRWQSGTVSRQEAWCAVIDRLGNAHYGVIKRGGALEPSAPARPMRFTRLFRTGAAPP